MGCDITMFCEELKTIDGVIKWVNADLYVEHYSKNGFYKRVQLCIGRNYPMFTALCGVRGTEKSPKISAPRGIPIDSEDITKRWEEWTGDGHSSSYVTLREVKQFIKNNVPVKLSGQITHNQAAELDDNGIIPESWWEEIDSPRKDLVFREWEDDTYPPLDKLYKLMAERFDRYNKPDDIPEERLDNFRIIFWFDG